MHDLHLYHSVCATKLCDHSHSSQWVEIEVSSGGTIGLDLAPVLEILSQGAEHHPMDPV